MPQSISYIDGFNLFHGLQQAGWKRHYWLNLHQLSSEIFQVFGLPEGQTRYFTARVPDWHPSTADQDVWLKAVSTLRPNVQQYFGEFSARKCKLCPAAKSFITEKGSDVNLAAWALSDFAKGAASATLIITGDNDHVPTIHGIKRLSTAHRIIVACPPARSSRALRNAAGKSNYMDIDEALLAQCHLPDRVSEHIIKPAHWT